MLIIKGLLFLLYFNYKLFLKLNQPIFAYYYTILSMKFKRWGIGNLKKRKGVGVKIL